MGAQVAAVSVANAEFLDEGGIVHPTLSQILNAFGIAVQFELIEGGAVLKQLRRGREFLLEVGDAVAKGELQRQFDKANQVTAAPAAVAVEQVLVRVDVERGMSFLVQRTESHELRANANADTGTAPVVSLQEIQ